MTAAFVQKTSQHENAKATVDRTSEITSNGFIPECFQGNLSSIRFRCRFRFGKQTAQFFNAPNVICESGFHCWRNAKCLMKTAEVVIHEIESNRVTVVLDFLAECLKTSCHGFGSGVTPCGFQTDPSSGTDVGTAAAIRLVYNEGFAAP